MSTENQAASALSKAERDIDAGILQIINVIGPVTPVPWAPTWQKLLDEHTGSAVKMNVMPDPPSMDPDLNHAYQQAYNERMIAEIESRWGEGILDTLFDRAEEMFYNRGKD